MKRLLLIPLLLLGLVARPQNMTGPSGYGIQQKHIAALEFFRPPVLPDTLCNLAVNPVNGTCFGAIIVLESDSTVYMYDGVKWKAIGSATIAPTVTASNGLNKVVDDIRLGGTYSGVTQLIGASGSYFIVSHISEVTGSNLTDLVGDGAKQIIASDGSGSVASFTLSMHADGAGNRGILMKDNDHRVKVDSASFRMGTADDIGTFVFNVLDSLVTLAKYKNNVAEDSVLSTDINGVLKLKAVAAASGGSGYIQNQDVAPQASADFNIDGRGTADTLVGLRGLGIGADFRWTNSFGSVQLLHLPTGNVPFSTFGSSGIGIEGGLILGGGNTSMDFGGTIAPKFFERTNFVNANQLGTTSNHVLMYDPVSSRDKYLPFATLSAAIVKTLDDVVQANHTTVNDSIVIAPATNTRAVFRARATGTQPATLYLNNGTNVVQIQAQSANTGLTLSGNNGSVLSLIGTTAAAINFTTAPSQINFSGASSSQLVASPAGLDFRNSSLTQTNLISSTGTMTGGAATAANMFTTRQQVTDTVTARVLALPAPTWQNVMAAGNSSTIAANISIATNSTFALQAINTGATNAHGFYTRSDNGIPFRADIGANIYGQLNGGGRWLFGNNATDDGSSALQVNGNVATNSKFISSDGGTLSYVGSDGTGTTMGNFDDDYLSLWSNTAERVRILADGSVGINTTTPTSTLHVAGTVSMPITVLSGSLSLGNDPHYTIINRNTTGTPWTLGLPTASTCPGRMYRIVDEQSGNPTNWLIISPGYRQFGANKTQVASTHIGYAQSGSDLVEGGFSIIIQSDGTNWVFVGL